MEKVRIRPKIVIVILLIGLAGVLVALFLKHPALNPNPASTAPVRDGRPEAQIAASQTNPPPGNETAVTNDTIISHGNPATNGDSKKHRAYMRADPDKLSALQARDDTQSLQTVLSDLADSEKAIRLAAIESTIQFVSRDAIPVLTNLAVHTQDPSERTKLMDAADFLALPDWTKIHQQDPGAKIQRAPPNAQPPTSRP